jgi:hypothetical protein
MRAPVIDRFRYCPVELGLERVLRLDTFQGIASTIGQKHSILRFPGFGRIRCPAPIVIYEKLSGAPFQL